MSTAPTDAPPAAPAPALGIAPPLAPTRGGVRRWPPAGAGAAMRGRLWPATLAVTLGLCLLSFYAKGGLALETLTTSEIVMTIGAGLLLAALALAGLLRRPAYGLGPALGLLAFAALSGLSVIWSVQPDASWHDANRLLAYLAVFAAAVAMARVAPRRWPALLGAIALWAAIVCAYALMTKSLPTHFPKANEYARMYEPYGYWNALGLTGALGAICCLWLGARRSGHAILGALAYPGMGLMLLTLLLAYSRGALLALAVGVVAWFCVVPLRLRGAAVLLAGGVAAGAIAAWDFSDHMLSSEGVALSERAGAGHELGALVIAMLVVLALLGATVGFVTGRHAPAPALRRRAGMALIALIAVGVLAFVGALAHSQRGFTGSISHAYDTLTNTHASVSNTPERLTAVASVRAEYWDEALKVFSAHPALGVGADGYEVARLRYRTSPVSVKHAHGFVVQTLADLGIIGTLLALLLWLAWAAAAGRSTHPFNRRWASWRELRSGVRPGWRMLDSARLRGYGAERIGLLSMLCVVVVFGVHSLVDWTWYVPGDAIAALLCAGWLAGRGPLEAVAGESAGAPTQSSWRELLGVACTPSLTRGLLAAGLIAATLIAAWSQLQPRRSEDASEEALALIEDNPHAAMSAAQSAVSRDPLSAEALFALADVQRAREQTAAARETLERAVRLQPSNPQTWLELGRFEYMSDPGSALGALRAAIYLDPASISLTPPASSDAIRLYNEYLGALRASQTAATTTSTSLTSAISPRSPAARAALRAARLRHERELLGSRSPR